MNIKERNPIRSTFSSHRYHVYMIILVLAAGIIFRIWHIDADPPANLSWSDAPFTDEGMHICGARNIAVFGSEYWEIQPEKFEYPFLHYLYRLIFWVVGAGYAQARIPMIIFGVLTCLLVYLIAKNEIGPWYALFSGGILSINYIFVMFNRIAIVETIYVFFMVLMVYFYQQSRIKTSRAFLAGLALAVAGFFCKLHAFFILPAFLFLLVYHFRKSRGESPASLIIPKYMIAGLGSGFLVWTLVILIPWSGAFVRFILNQANYIYPELIPGNAPHMRWAQRVYETFISIFTIGSKTDFFFRMPVIALMAFIAFFHIREKHEDDNREREISCVKRFVQIWFAGGMAILLTMSNQPLRYYLFAIPPMCILAGYTLHDIFTLPRWNKWEMQGTGKVMYNFFVLFFIVNQFVLFIHVRLYPFMTDDPVPLDPLLLQSLGFSVPLTLLLFILFHNIPRHPVKMPAKMLSIALISGIVIVNVYQWVTWADAPRYTVVSCARDIEQLTGEKTVLTGSLAGTLGLGNNVYVSPRIVTTFQERQWTEFYFTHILIDHGEYMNTMNVLYGNLMNKAVFLRAYHVGTLNRYLYLISSWPRHPDAWTYKPSDYELGKEAHNNKEWEKAKSFYLSHIKTHPDHAETLFRLAQVEFYLNNDELLADFLRKSYYANKRSPKIYDPILDELISRLADFCKIKL